MCWAVCPEEKKNDLYGESWENVCSEGLRKSNPDTGNLLLGPLSEQLFKARAQLLLPITPTTHLRSSPFSNSFGLPVPGIYGVEPVFTARRGGACSQPQSSGA